MSQDEMFPSEAAAAKRANAERIDMGIGLTPRLIARQVIDAAFWSLEFLPMNRPTRFLDPSAGEGIFGSEARRWFAENGVPAVTRGVEPRRTGAPRLYDAFNRTNFEDFEDLAAPEIGYDVICTNPPFQPFFGWVPRLIGMLSPGGVLCLIHKTDVFQDSDRGAELFDAHPPALEFRISGRVNWYGPGLNPNTGKPWGFDNKLYSAWCWRKRSTMKTGWKSWMLPRLPSSDRRWTLPPGSTSEWAEFLCW